MRLEFESSSPAVSYNENAANHTQFPGRAEDIAFLLEQGVQAAQAGDRPRARALLLQVTRVEPGNENAWLWLASISEYPEELLAFLANVLEINPQNERAIQWTAATRSLLAKTHVQRGIAAAEDGSTDLALQFFHRALENDEQNQTAWLWLASLSDSNEGRIEFLERVLAINPDNQDAKTALRGARQNTARIMFEEARSAVAAGESSRAYAIVENALEEFPDMEDAWLLKSHLTDSFEEKLRCYERALEINPNNFSTRSNLDSLLSILETATPDPPAVETETFFSEMPIDPFASPADNFESTFEKDGPTQELELPYSPPEVEPVGSPAVYVPVEDVEPAYVLDVAGQQPSPEYLFESLANDQNDGSVLSFGEVSDDAYVNGHASTEDDVELPEPDDAEELQSADDSISIRDFFGSQEEAWENSSLNGSGGTGPLTSVCAFCSTENPVRAIRCDNCGTVLTLADLEMVLSNSRVNVELLRRSVDDMESARRSRELSSAELTDLAVGHLNLKNLQPGFACLQEASYKDPANVILADYLNTLIIRLDEIRRQEEAHADMPTGKRILVVDDSATVRNLIAGKLEKCGHEVACAEDGVQAMEMIDGFAPELVLLDIAMPRMDGYQVCKLIRGKAETKDIPVVMISGKDGFFDKVRGKMAGTTGYITKPFGPETLMKALDQYLVAGRHFEE